MNTSIDVNEHFAFGENWKSFTRVLNDSRIEQAEIGLRRLFPNDELDNARFLDIGCGSGLSSLAALRLGAATIDAVDIDPNSVQAANQTLTQFAPGGHWSTRVQSVFDLLPDTQYDVVYSWGVLHHTGDMWRAIRVAASMVRPGGLLAIALYRKTPSCSFWAWEKRLYAGAPRTMQAAMRAVYMSLLTLRMIRNRDNPIRHIRTYANNRGMSWSHDLHDWLGGYPYESASAEDVRSFLHQLGFEDVREFVHTPSSGLLGTGCDEYVVRKA